MLIGGISSAFAVLLPNFVETFISTESEVMSIGSVFGFFFMNIEFLFFTMHLTYVLLQVSWIGSSDFGLCLCSGPVAASLVNRYGCRLVTILGTIISVLATIMATMAPNISYMIVSHGPNIITTHCPLLQC